MLPCPLYKLTGLQCPFCGGQRQIMALIHGSFVEAWNLNPILFVMMPYLVLRLSIEFSTKLRQTKIAAVCASSRADLVVIAIFTLWGIIRNII